MEVKAKKVIVIRADASTRMGTGHIMRCLTLAAKLKDDNCTVIFLSKQHPGHLNDFIEKSGFEVIPLSKPVNRPETENNEQLWLGCHYQDDAKECLQRINDKTLKHIDLLIVDHYSLDYQWQDLLKTVCDKVMVIDDLANRKHHCDILLDQTFGRTQQDYQALVPEQCSLLLGKEFMLLRDEFYQAIALAKAKRLSVKDSEPNHVLISLGGTDPDNIASSILYWLISMRADYSELKVCLVANGNSSFISELNTLTHKHSWIDIIIKPASMAKLMLNADIAIGSSGATAWERCCLGLPTLSIISAENQQLVSKNLMNAGANISLGCFKELKVQTFKEAFTKLFNDKIHYQQMVQQSFACCDGLGTSRVAKRVLQKTSTIELKLATIKDKEITFEWQSDKNIRQYFKQPTTPTKTEHCSWFDNNLADPASSLYIIHYNKVPVGTLRLDEQSQDEYEISILIAPSAQGKGIALNALNKIPRLKENGLFFADIHQDNINSIKVFKKAGFVPISSSRYCLQIEVQNSFRVNNTNERKRNNQVKSPSKALLKLATSSQNLQNRANGNQQYASADFGSWVEQIIDNYDKTNVLDICCGTGNQLVIYAKKPIKSITGLDISTQSIEIAQQRLVDYQGDLTLVTSAMEDYLSTVPHSSKDFISSFYGLYYTNDIEKTCLQIYQTLQPQGHFLVCGPHGDNNNSLFKLLKKYYSLPELVTYSSSTFMLQTLAPILEKLAMQLEYQYFVNTISYPNVDAVMKYLQSTTFFNKQFYQEIKSDLDLHFKENNSFDVEKHVMALVASKTN